jgi:hypothetical protein
MYVGVNFSSLAVPSWNVAGRTLQNIFKMFQQYFLLEGTLFADQLRKLR